MRLAQVQEVTMHGVGLSVPVSLGQIQLALLERGQIDGRRQCRDDRRVQHTDKLRKKFQPSLANGLAQFLPVIGKKQEWCSRGELLPLKQQGRRWSEQRQRTNGPISPRGRDLMKPSP